MKPMTYGELQAKLQKEKEKDQGIGILRFAEKGILIVGWPDSVDMFDTLMDRYIPTYYTRDIHQQDDAFNFGMRTYRRFL